ncbi:MAG: nickel-dependent lactate racemase [Deltaproteobacteria bacterium]|nr:nickel-dependent lactate racemase [Deltaproteobacteria bacterium]
MEIPIPYGQEHVSVRVPDENVLAVVHPNRVNIAPERETLLGALEHPVKSPSFYEFLDDARDVLFIVNDGTRPTPTAKVLEILHERIRGIDSRFIVATGAHREPTEEEFRFIFGRLYGELRDRVHVHDSHDSSQMIHVGTSRNGTEMYVNRLGVEAHKLMVIGSVEPHYIAGYTGGRKFFLPGIASYGTVERNHSYAISPDVRPLALAGNPVHEDMMDAMGTLGDKEIFSIQLVLDRDRRIYAAAAGDINGSFDAAIERANEVFCVPLDKKADIVISVAPYPMDIDLYQSQKALDNSKLALKDGGVTIMVSKCRKGVGEEAFLDLLGSASTPEEIMEKIAGEYKLGYHKAAKMAQIGTWASIYGVTDLPFETMNKAHLKPFASVQEALDAAILEIKGKGREPTLVIMPAGSLTIPLVRGDY